MERDLAFYHRATADTVPAFLETAWAATRARRDLVASRKFLAAYFMFDVAGRVATATGRPARTQARPAEARRIARLVAYPHA